MPEYRVREGKRHGGFGQYGPGDVVTLTEVEAAGFLDKLERVEAALPVPEPDIAHEQREEIASEPVPDTITMSVPPTPPTPERVDFTEVDGIGPEIRQALYDAGYNTWEDVLQAGAVKVKDDVSGLSLSRARKLFDKAQFEG